MKKNSCALLAACLCVVVLQAQNTPPSPALTKLVQAKTAISAMYVDKVDDNKLVEEAIIRMLAQLDPHSTYSTQEEVKRMNEPLQGNFEGIGVQFQMIEDTLLVVQPVSNGPSEKAGILAGDRIIAVNDSAIAGVKMASEEIMRRLRGSKGSEVVLTIVRIGVAEPLKFTVRRDTIPIYSLDASYLIEPKIGYIRINRFGSTTSEEFKKAMRSLQKQGMKDLILDLQGNGGGFLSAAFDIANEFLNAKELVVYTQGRAQPRANFFAQGTGSFKKGRLVVLVDEYTASASEIVSGAIQDWDRGVIVGRRTFGKGLVQKPIDLIDGSMIRLTISRYYTPSGRSIQKPYEGKSDKEENIRNYELDILSRFNRGELIHADSIHFPDSLKAQTQRLKRTVYGGGGIMPDIFVPIDTTLYTDYHRNLVGKGVIIKFTMKYIEDHRKELSGKFASFADFHKQFLINQEMLTTLREMGEKEGVTFDDKQYEISLPLIKAQLKGLLARDLWDINEYFQVMNETNPIVQRALQLLLTGEYEKKLK